MWKTKGSAREEKFSRKSLKCAARLSAHFFLVFKVRNQPNRYCICTHAQIGTHTFVYTRE